MENDYVLRYLPRFEEELTDIVNYITYTLKNPSAAENLIDDVEKAIIKRLNTPLSYEPCRSIYDREHDYYRIYVKNYVVYYVVIENVMEVRRIVYGKRDRERLV